MPIYEYKCANCDYEFEKMQKITEEPLSVCPRCEGKVEKKWSLSGFQFKGAGWYVTDYTNRGKETSTSESKTETKTETKSESSGETAKVSTPAATTSSGNGASEK